MNFNVKEIATALSPGSWIRRGVSLNSTQREQLSNAIGKVLQDPQIASSTTNTSVDSNGKPKSGTWWGNNTQLIIYPSEGAVGSYTHNYSANKGEKEILLPANSRYWLQEVEEVNGKTLVHAILLPHTEGDEKLLKSKTHPTWSEMKHHWDYKSLGSSPDQVDETGKFK